MDKYMLIFRNIPTSEEIYQNTSPEDMQASLDQWNAWIGGIAAQGKLIASDALVDSGRIITGSKKILTDGPYVEGKEIVSGYLLMQAEDEAEAIEAAQGCPIYDTEGSLEVRKLMVFN